MCHIAGEQWISISIHYLFGIFLRILSLSETLGLNSIVTMFLGAFPVENTVDVVLESEFLIRGNWLQSSNPKLPRVVQRAIRYPKVAVRFPNPV